MMIKVTKCDHDLLHVEIGNRGPVHPTRCCSGRKRMVLANWAMDVEAWKDLLAVVADGMCEAAWDDYKGGV